MKAVKHATNLKLRSAAYVELCWTQAEARHNLNPFVGDNDERTLISPRERIILAEVTAEDEMLKRRDLAHPADKRENRSREVLKLPRMIAAAASIQLDQPTVEKRRRTDEQMQSKSAVHVFSHKGLAIGQEELDDNALRKLGLELASTKVRVAARLKGPKPARYHRARESRRVVLIAQSDRSRDTSTGAWTEGEGQSL